MLRLCLCPEIEGKNSPSRHLPLECPATHRGLCISEICLNRSLSREVQGGCLLSSTKACGAARGLNQEFSVRFSLSKQHGILRMKPIAMIGIHHSQCPAS